MDSRKSRQTLTASPASTSTSTTTTTSPSSTTKGVQKFYTKIRHKIEDLPPKISARLHKNSKHSSASNLSPIGKFTSLNACTKGKPKLHTPKLVTKSVQTSPVKEVRKNSTPKLVSKSQSESNSIYEQIEVISSNPNGTMSSVYIDSDEECRLSLNDSKLSLEDEIFEELEKVAHDEAKLNAVLKNFDKILTDFGPKKPTSASTSTTECKSLDMSLPIASVSASASASPSYKKLQKSKTCSIIESRCILKKSVSEPKSDIEKLSAGLNKQTNLNTTKSLWNLKDFEDFAKSGKRLEKFENCKLPVYTGFTALNKSIGSSSVMNSPATRSPVKIASLRSKSVWELSGSTQSISASRSKIPIMKCSSIKSLNSRSNSVCDIQILQKSRSPPSVSKIVKKINDKSPAPLKPFNRATSSLAASTPKLSSTLANQRRKSLSTAVSTPHSLNRIGGSNTNKTSPMIKSTMKPATSEVSLKKTSPSTTKYTPLRKQHSSDVLLDKCLEKGHEILRKVEAISSVTKLDRKPKSSSAVTVPSATKKPSSSSPRNYARIKEQSAAKVMKEKNSKTAAKRVIGKNNISSTSTSTSTNNSKELKPDVKNVKVTPQLSLATQSSNNDHISMNQAPIDTIDSAQTLLYAKEETIKFPHLESCKIIPPILGSTSEEHAELLVNVKTKQPDLKPSQTTTPILIDRICSNPLDNIAKELYPDSDHDSDDSGHISNENDELLTVTSGECGSSGSSSSSSSRSTSESTSSSCKEDSSPPSGLPSTSPHQRLAASTKISELLEKFEHNSSNNNIQRQHHQLQIPSKKICTAVKIAEVEPVKCIQTHIEIYPTYSKEVILRLL